MEVRYNTESYFRESLIRRTGFREYDARWVVEPNHDKAEPDLNYVGMRSLGEGLGHFLREELRAGRSIVVGHDYRRYSENVKNALVIGLLSAGMNVTDIGLTVTPGAYYAQYALGVPCVAMVTASHNENGWTGMKMGHGYSCTFGPVEMERFREFMLARATETPVQTSAVAGSYRFLPSFASRYIEHLVESWQPLFEGLPRFKVAVETGNGTAGAYLPSVVSRLGFEVAAGNVDLDWDFPHFNPNPESIPFLRSVEQLVRRTGSDLGLCVDGDGDRLGVVDDAGSLVFADRIGLLIAKRLEDDFGDDRPVVIDVKSTSLFETELRSPVCWAKTGHSYVKAKVAEVNALAGFERSGHYFFREPIGKGYDDACVAAVATLWVLASARSANPSATLSDLLKTLPPSFASANRQPKIPDEHKYEVVSQIASALSQRDHFAGLEIVDVNLLNGIRITLTDRSWLLVRASSNSPNLVIVAEAFDEDGSLLRAMDADLRALFEGLALDLGEFGPLYEY